MSNPFETPFDLTVMGSSWQILEQRQCRSLGDALTMVGNAQKCFGATHFEITHRDSGKRLVQGETHTWPPVAVPAKVATDGVQ